MCPRLQATKKGKQENDQSHRNYPDPRCSDCNCQHTAPHSGGSCEHAALKMTYSQRCFYTEAARARARIAALLSTVAEGLFVYPIAGGGEEPVYLQKRDREPTLRAATAEYPKSHPPAGSRGTGHAHDRVPPAKTRHGAAQYGNHPKSQAKGPGPRQICGAVPAISS